MNVNTIIPSTIKTSYIPKKINDKQEFKKILDKSSTETPGETKNMNKVTSKNEKDDGEKSTKKQSKQLKDADNSADITTDKSVQINQALQALRNLVKNVQGVSTTNNGTNELNAKNLEQLAEIKKLAPEIKGDVKNDIREIVTLINQLKGKNVTSRQVLDVAEKLTTKVTDLKEKLSLLKVIGEKSTKKQLQSNGNVIETSTDKSVQINQAVKSLGDLVKSLAPEIKGDVKNDISEIVTLINQLKGKNVTSLQILDVAEKLTIKVSDLKGNLNQLKEINGKNTKKQSKQLLSTGNVIETSTDKSVQINQALQSLSDLVKSLQKNLTTNNVTNKLDSNNLEQLAEVQKAEPDTNSIIKNNLSKIVSMINQLEVKNATSPQMIDDLKKLITQVNEIKGDLTVVKDNSNEKSLKKSVKTTFDIASINQKQISSDNGGEKKSTDNKSSGNKSFEEKFLNGLLGKDKDESKISKAVTFMNQFENVKTSDLTKVEVSNITVNKNNFDADVIKNVKFMETNNIKDLIVKMNPKELGEITIKLTMESGVIKANITAQSKDTYNLLNTNVQDISDRLKNMDIKIHSLDIGIYEDSTFFSKDSNGKNNNGTQNNNGGQNNNSKISMDSQEDISTINNNVMEENQINKFV